MDELAKHHIVAPMSYAEAMLILVSDFRVAHAHEDIPTLTHIEPLAVRGDGEMALVKVTVAHGAEATVEVPAEFARKAIIELDPQAWKRLAHVIAAPFN